VQQNQRHLGYKLYSIVLTHRNFLEKAAHEMYILEQLYNNVECSFLFYSTEWNIIMCTDADFAIP